MSRDVRRKIAAGEELDEADIQYARERGIRIPDPGASDVPVPSNPAPEPPAPEPDAEPTIRREPAAAQPLPEASDLESLSKKEIAALAEQRGLELNPNRMSKAAMIDAMSADVS